MAQLKDSMSPLHIPTEELMVWGERWLSDVNPETSKAKNPNAFDRQQSVNFASFMDSAFANTLADALGGIPVRIPNRNSLLPPIENCVVLVLQRKVG